MERLTLRDDDGRALLTPYGLRIYCSAQATADCICKLEEALNAQEPKGKAYWIQRAGRGHGWNCSNCGEKISYNEEQKTRQKRVLPVWLVNKYCRGCGREMTHPPAHE